LERKLRKVQRRMKEEEKKFGEQHESIVSMQERCRKMDEIVKFRIAE